MNSTFPKLDEEECRFVINAVDHYLRTNFAMSGLNELEKAMNLRRMVIAKINSAKQWASE